MFADLFPTGRGRPSVPADVMVSVITLQALHGLSDSETVDVVAFDLWCRTACGMVVSAEAFHPTTLTCWRRRSATSPRPGNVATAPRPARPDGHWCTAGPSTETMPVSSLSSFREDKPVSGQHPTGR
jgi:Transposase domain (DUF772)